MSCCLREVTVITLPASRLPRPWNGEGESIGMVPLLRAEGGEKEPALGEGVAHATAG